MLVMRTILNFEYCNVFFTEWKLISLQKKTKSQFWDMTIFWQMCEIYTTYVCMYVRMDVCQTDSLSNCCGRKFETCQKQKKINKTETKIRKVTFYMFRHVVIKKSVSKKPQKCCNFASYCHTNTRTHIYVHPHPATWRASKIHTAKDTGQEPQKHNKQLLL